MKKIIFLITAFLITQMAFAGTQTGKITAIRVSSPSVLNPTHFQLDGPWENKPACATVWWAIDTDTPQGKSLLSILLTAHSTGKTITVWGQNLCSLRNDMETAIQIGL